MKDNTQKEILIKEVETKTLTEFVTSKKEKKSNPNHSRMITKDFTNITEFIYGFADNNKVLKKLENEIKRIKQDFKENKEITIKDFKVLNVINQNKFCKILLVEYTSGEKFMMKTLRKEYLLDKELIERTLFEKKIMQSLSHPFLISMNFCFQNDETIYLVMPFMM